MFKTGAINKLKKNYIDKLWYSVKLRICDHVVVFWEETRDNEIGIVAELEFLPRNTHCFCKKIYSLFIQNTLDL